MRGDATLRTMGRTAGRRVLLIVNGRKPDAVRGAAEAAELISAHGSVVGQVDVVEGEPPQTGAGVDLLVVLGGDGTLLTAARRFGHLGVPFVGVNAGRVGFMAEFDFEALREQAQQIFGDGALSTTDLPTLSAFVQAEDGTASESRALNEFVITAGPPYRMITIRVLIDGVVGPSISGDGLIVSTPTGSTAYNVSAGGPIVAPGLDAMVLTPIAAHSLSFRPIVLPSRRRIELAIESANTETEIGTSLVGDGQLLRPMRPGDRVSVTGGSRRVSFVVNLETNYWTILMGKMRWAERPKVRGDR